MTIRHRPSTIVVLAGLRHRSGHSALRTGWAWAAPDRLFIHDSVSWRVTSVASAPPQSSFRVQLAPASRLSCTGCHAQFGAQCASSVRELTGAQCQWAQRRAAAVRCQRLLSWPALGVLPSYVGTSQVEVVHAAPASGSPPAQEQPGTPHPAPRSSLCASPQAVIDMLVGQ